MERMAHRIPLPGRNSFMSLSPAKKMRLNTRKCFSMSLNEGAGHSSALRHPNSSPHQDHSKGPTAIKLEGKDQKISQNFSKADHSRSHYWRSLFASHDATKAGCSSVNPGHTIFTSPSATKAAVFDIVDMMEIPQDPGDAAVIFASPRHASWLTDTEFMAGLIQRLLRNQLNTEVKSDPASPSKVLNVLTAVVDGLHPKIGGQEMQEGLSLQFGSLERLLPGLWNEAPIEMPEIQKRPLSPDLESAHVSVAFGRSKKHCKKCTVTLPLANTLFHNGRRTTLMASEWLADSSRDQPVTLLRMIPKRTQEISLRMPSTRILCPLVPITHPRKIVEGLGNILAKVDVDGELSPASKELQVNIPLLLQARQLRSKSEPKSARVGVWALILPERLFVHSDVQPQSSDMPPRNPISIFEGKVQMRRLKYAVGKLAFEMESVSGRRAWKRTGMMGDILFKGGRLHQILSGGGEWGAKASLLSLDPQTSYGKASEDDELDRFQKAFHGQDTTDGAIARPGDYVQFFVEGDSELPLESGTTPLLRTSEAQYPSTAFGVGGYSKEGYATATVDDSVSGQRTLVQLAENHFGAFSAEGMYLQTGSPNNLSKGLWSTTKLNVPGMIIISGERGLAS